MTSPLTKSLTRLERVCGKAMILFVFFLLMVVVDRGRQPGPQCTLWCHTKHRLVESFDWSESRVASSFILYQSILVAMPERACKWSMLLRQQGGRRPSPHGNEKRCGAHLQNLAPVEPDLLQLQALGLLGVAVLLYEGLFGLHLRKGHTDTSNTPHATLCVSHTSGICL